jgi:hypothetical protein
MIVKNLDLLRPLHGAFSSARHTRSRITNTISDFFVEKMCQVIVKKPAQFNLFDCKEVFGE